MMLTHAATMLSIPPCSNGRSTTVLPRQISLNFKIDNVCHQAELDGIPKFTENVDAINIATFASQVYYFASPNPPWLLAFIHR